jgi:WhiB family transcriptional regulator, redox-sensing transcriptional regulator
MRTLTPTTIPPDLRGAPVRMPAALGPRQAAVLAHLAEHPGLTAGELAHQFGLRASLYKQLARLEGMACIVGVPVWNPDQGRQVTHWHIAPPGTVPPPLPAPDPDAVRRRERDTAAQRTRRARRASPRRPGPRTVPPVLASAACKGADPDLFFAPDAERVTDRQRRVAQAKAICAGCPVRAACLDWALETGQAFGVWGGADEDERRAMRRRSARRAS